MRFSGDQFRFIVTKCTEIQVELEKALSKAQDDQDEIYRRRQIDWMKTTRMAVVISEEQGEMEKFRKWDIDITPHRQLIKQGFDCKDDG